MKTQDNSTQGIQGKPEDHKRIWDEMDAEERGQPRAEGAQDPGDQQPVQTQEEGKGEAAQAAEKPETQPAQDAKPEAAEKAAKEAQPDEQVDPLEGVPQFVRDELAGLRSQVESLQRRTRNAEGKLGELNGRLQQETAKQVRAEGGDAPSQAELKAAQGDSEATKQLLEDYPEFGAAMLAALKEQLQLARKQEPRPQEPQQPTVTPADLAAMRIDMQIEAAHKGWKETVATPAFDGWLQRQSREVQMLSKSPEPEDAIRLLDLHAEHLQALAPRQQTQRSAAAIPDGRPSGRGRQAKSEEEMTPAEYWAYLDQLERAEARAKA